MSEKYIWPFPVKPSAGHHAVPVLWKYSSVVVSSAVGIISKLWLCKFNNTIIYQGDTLLKAVHNRPSNTALVTVSNHYGCLDDPLLWGCLKWNLLLHPSKLRWTLGAHDICFNTRLNGRFFALGKVVPVVRGGGVYQRGMDFVLSKLNGGGWTHVFPEGRVNVDKQWIRLKWGVGRLVCECQRRVVVLPLYHIGLDDILPNQRPYIPRLGKAVTIYVGSPMEFSERIAEWRAKGWNDKMMRKEITDAIQDELDRLRIKAYKFHENRVS